MDDETTSITDVGEVGKELHVVNDSLTSFVATFDTKGKDGASSTG